MESLEQRRVMTGGVDQVVRFNMPFLIDPLTSITATATYKFNNTTSNTIYGYVAISGPSDGYSYGAPITTSGISIISTQPNDSGGVKNCQFNFSLSPNSNSKIRVVVKPEADADNDNETITATSFLPSPYASTITKQLTVVDGLGLLYSIISICPACGCCKGNANTGASSQTIHSAYPVANTSNNVAMVNSPDLPLQNISSRQLSQDFIADLTIDGGSSSISTTMSLHDFVDVDNDGNYAWETVNGPTGYFTNASDASGIPADYRLSLPTPRTFTDTSSVSHNLPSGMYIAEVDVTRSGVMKQYFGIVNLVDNQFDYQDWGNGWGLTDQQQLAINDADGDGQLTVDDAAESSVITMNFGGSQVMFSRQLDGSFSHGSGDFEDLSLAFVSGNYVVSASDGAASVFDVTGKMLRKQDKAGNQENYQYFTSAEATAAGDALLTGHLKQVVQPDGTYVTLGYDSNRQVTLITDSNSQQTTLNRDATTHAITSIVYPSPGGSLLPPRMEFDYNSAGQLTARRLYPTESNTTTVESTSLSYDTSGKITAINQSDGRLESYTPARGIGSNLGTSSSPATLIKSQAVYGYETKNGVTTQYTYDMYGMVKTSVKNYVYGPASSDLQNLTTTYAYYAATDLDASGTPIGVSSAALGKLRSVTAPDPGGASAGEAAYTTNYFYDNTSGNLTKIVHPDGSTEVMEYTDTNNPGLVSKHTLTYSIQYQGESSATPHVQITMYTYDTSGNKIRQRQVVGSEDTLDLTGDPYNLNTSRNDLVTTWEYNNTSSILVAGLPTAVVDARGIRTEYVYNAHGTIDHVTYAASLSVAVSQYFKYDSSDRLTRKYILGYVPNGTDSNNTALHAYEAYGYDSLGRVISYQPVDADGTGTAYGVDTYTYTYDRENRLISETNPLSQVTSHLYQTNGSYTDSLPDHDSVNGNTNTVYTYDSYGRLSSTRNANFFTTSYGYDTAGRQTSVTLPDPDSVFSYNSTTGAVTQTSTGSLTSPVLQTSYDAMGRVATTTDALGYVTNYAYSNYGQTVTITDPAAATSGDRLQRVSYYDGAGNLYKLDEAKLVGSTTTILRTTAYVYDQLNRVTEVWKSKPDAAGTLFKAAVYVYDKDGNRLTETNTRTLNSSTGAPLDTLTTTYVYDARNRVTTVTGEDADGSSGTTGDTPIWQYQYTDSSYSNVNSTMLTKKPGGVLDPVTPANNVVTAEVHDARGRLLSITLPNPQGPSYGAGPATTYSYDELDRVTFVKDALNNYTENIYDALGNVTESRAEDGSKSSVSTTKHAYDAGGRLLWTYDPVGGLTNYTYDDLDRLIEVLMPDPDNAVNTTSYTYTTSTGSPRPEISYTYDANGNRLTETNELTKTTTYAYDHLNRLTSRTDPTISAGTPVTSYQYDIFGKRTQLTDPNSLVYKWQYDLLDRETYEQTPSMASASPQVNRSFEFDLAGNLTKRTDSLGRYITYTYDRLNRDTSEKSYNAAGTQSYQQDFTYYVNGQLHEAKGTLKPANTVVFDDTYTYNNTEWLATETPVQTGAVTTVFTPGYDAGGRRTSLTSTLNSTADFKNEYHYDVMGRIDWQKQYGQSGGNAVADKYVTFAYNGASEISSINRYANLTGTQLVATTTNTYDYLQRLTSIAHTKGSTTLASYAFTYDNRSRITAIDDVFATSSWNESHAYTYDDTDQLLTADHSAQSDESYAYDKNGDRTGSQTHLGATQSYTLTANKRVNDDGVYTYAYDAEGHRVTRVNKTTSQRDEYTYDNYDRVSFIQIKNSAGTVIKTMLYRYDHENRLLSSQQDPDGATGSAANLYTFYVHDGNQIVMQFSKTGSGSVTLGDRYLWGPQVDQLLTDEKVTSLSSAGTVYWVLADQLGTVRDLVTYNSGTDTTTDVKHRSFDAFGNVTGDSATTIIIGFGYTGKLFDSVTSLQWNINRWYDPFLGQWISEDPIGFAGGQENLRMYVGNEPVDQTDLDGQTKTKKGGGNNGPSVMPKAVGTKLPPATGVNDPNRYYVIIFVRATEVNNSGHCAVSVVDMFGRPNVYTRGFYPKDSEEVSNRDTEVPGTFKDDSDMGFDRGRAYVINANQYANLIWQLRNDQLNPPQYRPSTNNCNGYVVKLVESFGIRPGIPEPTDILGAATLPGERRFRPRVTKEHFEQPIEKVIDITP